MKTQARLKDGRTLSVSISDFDFQELEIEEISESDEYKDLEFYTINMSLTDVVTSPFFGSSEIKFSFTVTYDEVEQCVSIFNFRQVDYSFLQYSLDGLDELELLVMSYLSVEIN